MGNSTDFKSIYEDKTVWKIVAIRLNYAIIKNSITNQQLEQYLIIFDTQTFDQERQIRLFEERKMHNDYIVQLVYYYKQKNDSLCKANQHYHVITERLNRFNTLTNLDQNRGFNLLKQSLIAYQYALKKYGRFNVNASMIGINSQGRIKIWINQNFGQNTISKEGNEHFSQEQNIYSIHKMIADKVQSYQFKHIFSFCDHKLTLQVALAYLNSYTIQINKKINKSIEAYRSRLGPHFQLKFNYPIQNNSLKELKKIGVVKKVMPQFHVPIQFNQLNSKISNGFDYSEIYKGSSTTSMNPTNTNTYTYTSSNISNQRIQVSQLEKKESNKQHSYELNKKNKYYKSASRINSRDVNIQSTKQEFSKLSLRNKLSQTNKKSTEAQNEKQLKLESIAKIDSIIVIEKQEDYLKNTDYTNGLNDNVLLVESTILRS